MNSYSPKIIESLKDCINSELMCFQTIAQKPNGPVKKFFLQETKRSIKNNQEILKQLTMPKLSVNCMFKSAGNRMFKVKTFGFADGEDVWHIQEVEEVIHDKKKFIEPIGNIFKKTFKEMNWAIDEGKIIIL